MKDYTVEIAPGRDLDAMALVISIGRVGGKCSLDLTDLDNYRISVEKPISEEYALILEQADVKILER